MIIVAIFFTVLCGALAIMTIQLRVSIQNDPTRKIFQKLQTDQKEREERKKRLNATFARIKEEAEFMTMWKDTRISLLKCKLHRTAEEEEELANYHAEAEHDKAIATTGMMSTTVYQLFSQRLIEEHTVAPNADPSMPQPLSLGMIVWKLPSTQQMIDNMKIHARARIGTVIPWRQDHDNIRFHHITDYMMVRVNAPHRWIQLSVTRYKTDSCDEILIRHLKTLGADLFSPYLIQGMDTEKMTPSKIEWRVWDPVTQTLN
jgi:hypothetical protein